MTFEKIRLDPGLYFVATPIGSARDITLRALDVLYSADVLAAEDTRTLKRLMQIHGVPLGDRKIIAYHDHNGGKVRPRLMGLIADGKSVAYASEAGTPLVADPGFQLAKDAYDQGFAVTSAPGPSAVIAALSIAGLPTDRFMFAGFPPAAKGARLTWLKEVTAIPATVVIYETPKRIHRLLAEIAGLVGGNRKTAVCRELTKRFEEVIRGTLDEVQTTLQDRALKGEIVLVLDRDRAEPDAEDLEKCLEEALRSLTIRDAASKVSEDLGLPRRQVYQMALKMGNSE